MTLDETLQRWTPQVLSLLRITSGLFLLQFGTAKVLGFPELSYFADLTLTSLAGTAGMIELVLSPLLIAGLFTRPVAFVLSGLMACAYFIGHAPQHYLVPLLNGGTLAALFCFVFFYLAFAGGGSWSLDACWRQRP